MRELEQKILDISYRDKLSHIGSCLTAVNAIDAIYSIKQPNEKFILSSGHAGLALYVVLEKYGEAKAEELLKDMGIHPERRHKAIYASTGSLGQGLPIALGMALSDRTKNVYCLISDGEMSEGSIWESLRIAQEQSLTNLKVILNYNGWAAYKEVNKVTLMNQIRGFGWATIQVNGHDKEEIANALKCTNKYPILVWANTKVNGQEDHYKVLTKEDYETYK